MITSKRTGIINADLMLINHFIMVGIGMDEHNFSGVLGWYTVTVEVTVNQMAVAYA